MKRKSAWLKYDDNGRAAIQEFAAEYRTFLNRGKTERECVYNVIKLAEAAGFTEFSKHNRQCGGIKAGDKVYFVNMDKNIVLYHIGRENLTDGLNIVAAHIDSPRLDIKAKPLYEAGDLAYLDTHYYGGLKKYQWTAMPLALHGTVVKKDGSHIELSVGEADAEPVFCITDLLPHLASEQMKKAGGEAVEGEKLDILMGSRPAAGDGKDLVLKAVQQLLTEQYGIAEQDFLSAELEAVPAGAARSMGLDASMTLAYGQDDRACAFAALQAVLAIAAPKRTACCILTDKEEIGSVGATGMSGAFFANTVAELAAAAGFASGLALRRILQRSRALSADVGAAYDSLYSNVFDAKNTSRLGFGPLVKKFTGARGKSGASDANAETLGWLRCVADAAAVSCQPMETGKVDAGGGGTIAYILAKLGMEVVDVGVPILSMHAPWEVTSAVDVFEASRLYRAFYENK